jgi:hypothetical protein
MANLVCICIPLTSIFKKPGKDRLSQIASNSENLALSDGSVSPNRLDRSEAPSPPSREAIMETCREVYTQWPRGC